MTEKFKKTAEYLHGGETRVLRAETSASVPNGMWMRIDAGSGVAVGQALNYSRDEVVQFRDFLNRWLDATPEVLLPAAVGSRIVINYPTSSINTREYIRVGENAWVRVDARRAAMGDTKTDLYIDSDFGSNWTLVKDAA